MTNQKDNMLSVDQAMRLASEYQSSGNLQQSENILRNILAVQPNHAWALHLLGVVAYQAGNIDAALSLIQRAIQIDGRVALFHSNFGEMSRLIKKYADAITHGERAVSLDPTMASAHSNLGIAYFDIKDFDKAEACQMRALAIDPNLPSALNNMGSIFRERKMPVQALTYYEKAHQANNNYIEPVCNITTVLIQEDRFEEAIPLIRKVLAIEPNNPEALCNLGSAQLSREEIEHAFACFYKALTTHPKHATAMSGMARVYLESSRLQDALSMVNQAIEIEPTKDSFYLLRGQILQDMQQPELALNDYDKAFSLNSSELRALLAKAHLYLELGELQLAEKILKELLEIDPNDVSAIAQLVITYKVKDNDPYMNALQKLFEKGEVRKITDKIGGHFALGKCYEDVGCYDKAFSEFLEANQLKRSIINYNSQEEQDRNQRIIDVFTSKYIQERLSFGFDDERPVFVVGMPRSGTTLVEQIISSHPSVYGAGELPHLAMFVRKTADERKLTVADLMSNLDSEAVSCIGKQYLDVLTTFDESAKRITDKMPNNYLHLGLIKIIFPKAKIIHVKRHPLDVCLSNFSRLFHKGQRHSYDLAELGSHYRDYARLMEHWRATLGENSFFEIQYEELIENTDLYARQLIEYCGLDWHDACLEFYNTKRRIKTASIVQVRQPIYKTSVEKWRRYEKHLGPLREALGEFNPA